MVRNKNVSKQGKAQAQGKRTQGKRTGRTQGKRTGISIDTTHRLGKNMDHWERNTRTFPLNWTRHRI